jgi:hypothetical protein
MATTDTKTAWRITGELVVSCNCAWGCPCQFNALPTYGRCEGLGVWDIREGYFGETALDGVRFVQIVSWPASVPEGNGTRLLVMDERTTPEQRQALIAIESGEQGHPYFEIFAALCPTVVGPEVAAIAIEVDRDKRQARVRIPGVAEIGMEPITNPVTGEELRARIDLPNGFEFKLAEMANSVRWNVTADASLAMEHENTYGQLSALDWSSDGTTR